MNQLEKWRQDRIIEIDMPETAQAEAARGGGARASKAYTYIFSMTMAGTPAEFEMIRRIERVIFPDGVSTQSDHNDVDIVFNAYKYGCILVTNDGGSRRQPGGILGNRNALGELGIEILTDEEAVRLVRRLTEERDERERRISELTGRPLPSWVGLD